MKQIQITQNCNGTITSLSGTGYTIFSTVLVPSVLESLLLNKLKFYTQKLESGNHFYWFIVFLVFWYYYTSLSKLKTL
jgi:hypothetical protein